MHIVHITPYMERGGTERCIRNLAREALARGSTVSLVSPPGSGLDEVSPDIAVLMLDCWKISSLRRSLRSLHTTLTSLGDGVDIIHVHAAAEMAFWAKRCRPDTPVVFTCHGYDNILPSYCNYWWAARFLKGIECTVALNPLDRDYFQSAGLGQGRVVFIPNGVEEMFFANEVNGENKSDYLRVGIVGRLAKQKNISWAIKAMARYGFADELQVVGDGPLRAALEKLARRQKVAASIRFLGYRDDVHSLYSKLSALLVCSRNEAGQLVILEALAAGVPVFIPRWLTGIVRLWENVSGVIVYADGLDLKEKLARIVPAIDRKSIQDVTRRFAWPHAFGAYNELYQRLCRRQGARQ